MILTGALRGAGDTRWPLINTFVGLLMIRIPTGNCAGVARDHAAIRGTRRVAEPETTGCVVRDDSRSVRSYDADCLALSPRRMDADQGLARDAAIKEPRQDVKSHVHLAAQSTPREPPATSAAQHCTFPTNSRRWPPFDHCSFRANAAAATFRPPTAGVLDRIGIFQVPIQHEALSGSWPTRRQRMPLHGEDHPQAPALRDSTETRPTEP